MSPGIIEPFQDYMQTSSLSLVLVLIRNIMFTWTTVKPGYSSRCTHDSNIIKVSDHLLVQMCLASLCPPNLFHVCTD